MAKRYKGSIALPDYFKSIMDEINGVAYVTGVTTDAIHYEIEPDSEYDLGQTIYELTNSLNSLGGEMFVIDKPELIDE